MKNKTIKIIIAIVIALAAFKVGSDLDKEVLLYECVAETEGTDTDCEQCYEKVYGQKPQ